MNYKVAMESLGCSKNTVDAEIMLGILEQKGCLITKNFDQADIIIVNTCSFINSAKEEAIEVILENAEFKKTGKLKHLIMTGCLSQRYSKDLIKELPEVDGFLGTTSYTKIADLIENLENANAPIAWIDDINKEIKTDLNRKILTPKYSANLKIAEGCDNKCTYCIIPKLRGQYRSFPMEDILSEAKKLAKSGTKELIVIAQDTSRYGLDLYGEKKLSELLKKLENIEEIKWIRVLYTYPEEIDEKLVKVIKESRKICNYFDIPVQHCNDRILKLMNRKTTKQNIKSKIDMIRKEIPDSIIRTSLIVGFPGETQQEFEELKDFVEEIKFDKLGVFAYSREEDTPAYKLNNQIDEDIKDLRRDEIMSIQQQISTRNLRKFEDKNLEVLVEEIQEDYAVARTYADTPEIDGVVYVNPYKNMKVGEFINIKIIDTLDYDMVGEKIE